MTTVTSRRDALAVKWHLNVDHTITQTLDEFPSVVAPPIRVCKVVITNWLFNIGLGHILERSPVP
ncbi:MAG: hypothetical protein ACREHD_01745 [Pirellulales bacterium]